MPAGSSAAFASPSSLDEHGIASLPWYDIPEVRWANDRIWAAIRHSLAEMGVSSLPFTLERDSPPEVQWLSPRLHLSQACGYDVVLPFRNAVRVVAVPLYQVDECAPGEYRSLVVVRESSAYQCIADLRGAVCSINTPTSHSGMNGLRALVAPLAQEGRFFSAVRVSGSHEASARAVREGAADVAALDALTFALLKEHRPRALDGIRTIGFTSPMPAPPIVTSAASGDEHVMLIREALRRAVGDAELESARAALHILGYRNADAALYEPIAQLERDAIDQNYCEMPFHT